jgi:hypothetical protein
MEVQMRKILFILTIALAVGMISTSFAQTKVLSGYWSVSKNTQGYTLAENSGDRSVTITVNFLDPFENKPDVTLGVTLLDASSDKNVRYKVEALSVSRDAMTIKISTWADTKIYGISGYWMAHGE